MGTFADRLKEQRGKAGLTQAALAEEAGITRQAVAHLEQGLREPSWATVQAIARALGVSCQEFMDEPAKPKKTERGK